MKKVTILLVFTFLIIFLSSCLKTLHPIFTVKDIVYEQKLLGTWKAKASNDDLAFAVITNLSSDNSIELPEKIVAIKQKGYLILYKNQNGEIIDQFIAFLARIGEHLYFDYYPADKKEDRKLDEFWREHFIKMHTSFRVEIANDGSFELSQFDESYLTDLIDKKKIRISHETDPDDNVVITASTSALQRYIIKYGDDPSAYRSEKITFKK
jgi:hypothetical protein